MKLQSWGMRERRHLVGAHEGWGNREGLKEGEERGRKGQRVSVGLLDKEVV